MLFFMGAFIASLSFSVHHPFSCLKELTEEKSCYTTNPIPLAVTACTITDVKLQVSCDNNGTTNNYLDDTYTAKVTVEYENKPTTGTLDLTGSGTASISVNQIGPNSHTFTLPPVSAGIVPVQLSFTATFSSEPACTGSVTETNNNTQQCSVCPVAGAHGLDYPDCWPPEGTNLPACESSLKYAPDPEHPELTPVKYVRTVVHVFQKEDPSDPDNFTEDHLDVIKSFFDGAGGINDFLGNLCPAPDDSSPDISDARFRLVNTGTLNYDVFFHPDNRGWGTSYYSVPNCPCGQCCSDPDDCCTTCGPYKSLGLGTMETRYVTGGTNGTGWAASLDAAQIAALSDPDIRNAYHVFITRGRWRDCNDNNIPDPVGTDAYNFGTGGYTTTAYLDCEDDGTPPRTPLALFYGWYERFLNITDPAEIPKLGGGFVGELYHIMGIDHIGPLRTHYQHANGDDGCDDTPWESDSNVLGCNFSGQPGTKCALTQCQLGKIHYFFERLSPAVQRFPSGPGPHVPGGDGTYTMEGNCDINMPDISIENGEIIKWESNRQLRSNVIVKTGGKLYIYCRVGMPEGATITVEPGGRLFLYGEVYNNCDGQRWEGVVVNGNSGLPQGFPPTNQGYFVNLGIIEGANTSIRVESGGMVIGIGAAVRNSGGMLFEPYSFPQKGWFSGCDFTCDGNIYNFGGNPYKHAELHAVNNVRFGGCNFSVENVPAGQLSNMAGIVADGSMFRVTSGSTFRGFDTGIHAAGQFSSLNSFTVNNCTFSNNQTGIFAIGMQNFTVTENTFEVGGADFQANSPCGLMMDNCTGYTVEENTFYGTDNIATGRFGIMTEDSGDDANLISGNNFDYLEYANIAQGDNRGFLQGLQYHCNTNGNNARDFYVPGGFKQQGIHINQGDGLAAMNTFSHFGAFIDGDFRNEVGVITYNHKNDPAHEPNPNTPPGTGGINKINVQNDNTCPSDEPPCDFPCEYTATEWQQMEGDFYTARDNWHTEKASLLSLMDGGDTDGLLTEINGATSLNAGQVVQNLLNRSPWLSTQVLTAAINKKQVLTENSVVQILNANPDGLREAEVRSLVQSSFNQTVADGILANSGTQTARTAKELLVGQYRATMLRKADLLIQDILKDTTEIDVPLLRTWLANKQSLEADYAIVASYLSEGDFVTASQKLDDIPLTYSLDTEGLAEHGYFSDLADLWQDAHTNGRTMAELDQTGISGVQHIADNSQRRAGAVAQGIMNTWYGGHYRVVPVLPGGEGQQGLMAPSPGNSATPAANYLSVFPNPARGSVYFYWNLPEGTENATISITDLQGKVLEVLEIIGQKGKQEWSVERLEHGIYIFYVKLPDSNSQTSKLVIIK
jgi:Secretion system C-terminal sorting domain